MSRTPSSLESPARRGGLAANAWWFDPGIATGVVSAALQSS